MSTAFGTFGELLQGVLPEPDGDFLVTLPIARWSMATFRLDPACRTLRVRPAHKRKALALAEMILAAAGTRAGGVLTIGSSLPEGKGLASSSADLVATARAVGNALNLDLPPNTVEDLLRGIEPTDGVLYPGIVAFHHRTVRLRARLGSLPSMTIVGVDEGGTVDTVDFNRIAKPFSAAEHREYAHLLERLTTAVARRDLPAVGAVATRSAQLNQPLRPKRTLEAMLEISAGIGALGVVAAHSGTMLGILLDMREPAYAGKLAAAIHACSGLTRDVSLFRTLSFD
ncbi:hypothetical protein ACQP1K_26330 [Sphaerimonospora sp. CA-214678]|uniref:GHMP family kinase ATP-binding protein n=1 Tax=Sphaerimonospora sp. CA-214678 TaxID=3240029 RepID=UPI003D8B86DF